MKLKDGYAGVMTDAELTKERGKVKDAVQLYRDLGGNACTWGHTWNTRKLAEGVWLDNCENCDQVTLVFTNKDRPFLRKAKP